MSTSQRVVDVRETTGNIDADDLEQAIVEDRPAYQMPKKFEGKSAEEIAESHTQLEKRFGQQGQELGQLRQQVNQLLETNAAPKEEAKPVSADELLNDPDGTINTAVSQNPRLTEIERKLALSELKEQRAAFEQANPDWEDTVNSEGFQAWVNSSPVRRKMWEAADQRYNYEVANELFSTYRDIHSARSEQAENQRQQKVQKGLKDAGTVRRGAAVKSERRFKRPELIDLKLRDPAKYEAMYPEIHLAYQEGRVDEF